VSYFPLLKGFFNKGLFYIYLAVVLILLKISLTSGPGDPFLNLVFSFFLVFHVGFDFTGLFSFLSFLY